MATRIKVVSSVMLTLNGLLAAWVGFDEKNFPRFSPALTLLILFFALLSFVAAGILIYEVVKSKRQ